MNYIVNRIDLDVHDAGAQAWINVRQNETNRKICIALTESGEPFALTEDCDAVFAGTKPDATVFYNSCEIVGNTIEYVLTGQNLAQTGDLKCEIRLYGSGNTLICSPRFVVHVQENAVDDNGIESSDEFSELTELIGDARAATDAANASVITDATASVDSNVGTPRVELTLTQEENGQSMDFEFHNLKGETGDPGVHVGDTAPTNPAISLWIDTDDNGASQVLSVMGTFVSLAALQAAVTNPNNGDSYGVGAAAPYDIYRYDAASGEWINYGNYSGGITDSNLAWVENGSTASRAYAIGDYVTINGVLCKITAAVASGGTLISGTNYTAIGGNGGLANTFSTEVDNDPCAALSSPFTAITSLKLIRCGRIRILTGVISSSEATSSGQTITTLQNSSDFPFADVYTTSGNGGTNSLGLYITTSGVIKTYGAASGGRSYQPFSIIYCV